MYCTTDDVYRKAGITTAEISNDDMIENIKDAEAEIDRLTNTTYWSTEHSGTATGAGSSTNTLADTAANFDSVRSHKGDYLWIYSGTGANQLQKITSHTQTEITVEDDWTTEPDNTSKYKVIHCGHNPIRTEVRDGDDTTTLFTEKYPIVRLVSVEIDGTSVTTSYIYTYSKTGELKLGSSAEASRWSASDPQDNTIVFWYGVDEVPREIQKLTALRAAIDSLGEQMGGTHNIPSTYSVPEGSVSIGQAYVNIKGTMDELSKQYEELKQRVTKYPYFG